MIWIHYSFHVYCHRPELWSRLCMRLPGNQHCNSTRTSGRCDWAWQDETSLPSVRKSEYATRLPRREIAPRSGALIRQLATLLMIRAGYRSPEAILAMRGVKLLCPWRR